MKIVLIQCVCRTRGWEIFQNVIFSCIVASNILITAELRKWEPNGVHPTANAQNFAMSAAGPVHASRIESILVRYMYVTVRGYS
jgi:hypothetical protein